MQDLDFPIAIRMRSMEAWHYSYVYFFKSYTFETC